MDESPLNLLPQETLHQIFTLLPLPQIAISKCTCKHLYTSLSSPSCPPLPLLSLKPSPRHVSPSPTLHAFSPSPPSKWLKFSLSFLPFTSLHPITSSQGLLYLWATPTNIHFSQTTTSQKALVVCNPLTSRYKTLPQLGSAWSRHGSLLASGGRDCIIENYSYYNNNSSNRHCNNNTILVLTELAILYYCSSDNTWLKFSSNLPSKPRSPVLLTNGVLVTLCDVGSPWRPQWGMFRSEIVKGETSVKWGRVERKEWGEIFDVLKRPRLVKAGGDGDRMVYMVGGLKSGYGNGSTCSTILILRLDLDKGEWEEKGRMPVEMYRCFMESSKFKVFGGGNRVCFSSKRVGRLALWEDGGKEEEWRWVDGGPGSGDGLCRGFVFDARLDAVP